MSFHVEGKWHAERSSQWEIANNKGIRGVRKDLEIACRLSLDSTESAKSVQV